MRETDLDQSGDLSENKINIVGTVGGIVLFEKDDDTNTNDNTYDTEALSIYSTAGSRDAYTYWTKTASSIISDVAIVSSAPGEVDVYLLLDNGQLPTEEIIAAVLEILSDEKVRPFTDNVKVICPTTTRYDLDVTYYISSDNIAQQSNIKKNIEAAIDDWILWQRRKLGRDINPTELYYRMRKAGAKRATIISPDFTTVAASSIAVIGSKSVIYGGLEDG